MATARRPRWGFVLAGVVLLVLVIWFVLASHKPPPKRAPPPTAVTVAKVTVADVPVSITALGAAQPWQSVLINAQVSGKLLFVAPEGKDVAKGALLAEIDSAPYGAVLMQAQGALARDRALLQGARVDLARFQQLAAQDSIARQQVDDQAALVKQDEGLVLADQGTVAAAQVNVNYCRITSPVAGRVGVRLVDPGNIVTANAATGIISVNQIVPIAVTFTVPQGDFTRLSEASAGFSRPLAVQALSQETGAQLGTGLLSIADNHVDQTTGTVALKAQFANDQRQLWPGQFVNVILTLQTLSNAVTAPASAINQGPNGSFVYVVGADSKAAVRPVTVAATQDATAVIQSGLKPGETVVTDGQMSLRQGAPVNVRAPHPPRKPGA